MTRNKSRTKSSLRQQTAPARTAATLRTAPPTVSGRWLLIALAALLAAAVLCVWAALCILFWQGSWQLLYHPSATVTRTPADVGLAYTPVQFATNDAGVARLRGWWIPGGGAAKFTVLYLHGKAGNLGDAVDELGRLHAAGVNTLAFDYRGYGQSQFAHPSEANLRQDTDWALQSLTGTRHIDPRTVVLVGRGLGANLALEAAATHPELAGVVLESPLQSASDAIFYDERARLVPARLLVHDRWDLIAAAKAVRIPSLWIVQNPTAGQPASSTDAAYQEVTATKTRVWLPAGSTSQTKFNQALSQWLDALPSHPG